MKKSALIIVDVQNNYFEQGYCELYRPVETTQNIRKVLEQFRNEGKPVIFIQHRFQVEDQSKKGKDWYVKINDMIQPKDSESVLQKDVPNSFKNTGLQEKLQALKVTDLVITGMMSHMCIDTTVRAAFDHGYGITVIEDACCTKDMMTKHGVVDAQTVHDVFMGALGEVFAKVITTEEFFNISY